MLGQSTLFPYHTEANGYIFFATGVRQHLQGAFKRMAPLAVLNRAFFESHLTLWEIVTQQKSILVQTRKQPSRNPKSVVTFLATSEYIQRDPSCGNKRKCESLP